MTHSAAHFDHVLPENHATRTVIGLQLPVLGMQGPLHSRSLMVPKPYVGLGLTELREAGGDASARVGLRLHGLHLRLQAGDIGT